MNEVGVSSWSLHRLLGEFWAEDHPGAQRHHPQTPSTGLPLLELPAQLRSNGYTMLQVCHFHFPELGQAYLEEFRSELARNEIRLDALLIDDGDLTAANGDTHEQWISGWLHVAETLGADRARVIAGRAAPTPETIRVSGTRLRRLARNHSGIRVVTENWHELLSSPSAVLDLLDQCGGDVGLLIDLANWDGVNKQAQLEQIAFQAETCHAKANFGPGGLDISEFKETLSTVHNAGYRGPFALVYDGPDANEWDALREERTAVHEAIR
ncbi:sugar phosphate isomerase/epimerase family protein [Plantibacter sp. Mn2098]|uniref:sugar phosphate isomerase/epimerase family protein n=1 Tax=Plantibacter sp. Mn2098 TaxID=3395266 RepID=UPI003BD51E7D